ncbi:MAG: hypothetical protein LLF97_01805 [Planctomycetaceae bacterium]|nr:hypothetical protein [Planctomycetaceae bacterium]
MRKRGRPPVLDDGKRREVLAILSVGCSQAVAAQYVGCAPTTIQNTAERDSKFAVELNRAKCNAELGLVQNIRNAAKKEQYWRAAAWALERNFPEKYARHGPDVITVDHIGMLLAKFSEIVMQESSERSRAKICRRMQQLAQSLGIDLNKVVRDDPNP